MEVSQQQCIIIFYISYQYFLLLMLTSDIIMISVGKSLILNLNLIYRTMTIFCGKYILCSLTFYIFLMSWHDALVWPFVSWRMAGVVWLYAYFEEHLLVYMRQITMFATTSSTTTISDVDLVHDLHHFPSWSAFHLFVKSS